MPYKYLGVRITVTLDWKFEKASVLAKVTEAIEYLRDTAYTYKQLDRVVRTCIIPVFRYSAAIVPWTDSELAKLTVLFNRAMRKAWKLPRSFSSAVLQTPENEGGLGTPCAETLQFQEMWGLYEQSLSHEDSVGRILRWEFDDSKARHGCSTLQQVASTVYLQKGTTFVERLLGNLYGAGFELNQQEKTDSIPHSLVELFEEWKRSAVTEVKVMRGASWMEWIRGLPGATEGQDRDVTLKWARWKELQAKLKESSKAISILRKSRILSFDKLVATDLGDWISFGQLQRMTVGLTQETYDVFFKTLDELVSKERRIAIGADVSQLSLLRYYARVSKSDLIPTSVIGEKVPEPFRYLVEQFSPSREGREHSRAMVQRLQGEFPAKKKFRKQKKRADKYDSDTEHDPYQHIQNIEEVIDERMVSGELQLKCTFVPAGSPSPDKDVRAVQRSTVIREMIRRQAHVLVPSRFVFWYTPGSGHDVTQEAAFGDLGSQTIRIQGELSNGNLDCVIVDGPIKGDVGREIEGGIPYGGQFGVRSMIKHLKLSEVCHRGSEWVQAEAFGVNENECQSIHKVVWKHLVGNGLSALFEKKAPRCGGCGHSVVSEECTRLCTVNPRWEGRMQSAKNLPSRLVEGSAFKEPELWETKLSKLVTFDLSSSTQQVLRREGRESIHQRGGRVIIVSRKALESDTAPLTVSQPLFRVMEARASSASFMEMHELLSAAGEVDVHHRHLGIPFLSQLASIDQTTTAISIDPVTSGPVFESLLHHSAITTDTDLICYQSLIINLVHIPLDSHRHILERATAAAQAGTKITVLQQAAHKCTPEQLSIQNNLRVWATAATRITSRNPIWQPRNSWKTSRPKQSCWKGITIWIAGPREARIDRAVRVLHRPSSMDPTSNLVQAYVDALQGTQYVAQGHLLGATDGSVKTDADGDSVMGAGYCFSEGGPASKSFQVAGEAASLRSEAAAMWQALVAASTMPARSLVLLCDSLGLLQILQGFRRKDYQYHSDSSEHFDVIRLILEELNKRTASVLLVKVKSHVGIELNERADVLANAGLASEEILCDPPASTCPLWVSSGTSSRRISKAMIFKEYRARYHDLQRKIRRTTAGVTTRNFLEDGLGQRFSAKANKHLKMGNQRLWLLSKGDCYPTQYHRCRTGQASSDQCTLPGCEKRETYDHCVCSCRIVSSTARAVHDRVWRGIHDVIKTGVPKGVHTIYDTPIGKIPGLLSSDSIARLQPDGMVYTEGFVTIDLLEFTRTGDLWPDSLTSAKERKTDKYSTLSRELQLLYPTSTIRVIPFVMGSRSYVNESHWSESWAQLQLPPASLAKLLPKAQAWNVEAAREMLVVRSAVRKGIG